VAGARRRRRARLRRWALISAVSFDLAQEGVELGGGDSVALGLAVGALTYYLADRAVERLGRSPRPAASTTSVSTADAGTALALGAFLDGIPEQMVLGIGLAAGEGVSVGLLAAIFISNLPEAVGSATEMSAPVELLSRSCGSGPSSRSSARSPRSPAI
jgi:zinc transporter, ZIP family